MTAEDVGHLEGWPVHGSTRGGGLRFPGSSPLLRLGWRRRLIQRADDAADRLRRNRRITRRGFYTAMAEQNLDSAGVGAVFEQVCCKTVP